MRISGIPSIDNRGLRAKAGRRNNYSRNDEAACRRSVQAYIAERIGMRSSAAL